MITVKEIQSAVLQLSPEDLAAFRVCFIGFDAARLDQRFESDALEGKLDDLATEAVRDLDEGRCTDL